jgi:hypothetical protein
MSQSIPGAGASSLAFVETLESRRLLAATPIPNFVGDYVGSIQAAGAEPQTITLSITTQKKRALSGSFMQGDGVTATLKGNVARKGPSKFNFRSTNANPKFTGTASVAFNLTGDTLAGLFFIRTGKTKSTASFFGIKQT